MKEEDRKWLLNNGFVVGGDKAVLPDPPDPGKSSDPVFAAYVSAARGLAAGRPLRLSVDCDGLTYDAVAECGGLSSNMSSEEDLRGTLLQALVLLPL